jgi:hypothetical protein
VSKERFVQTIDGIYDSLAWRTFKNGTRNKLKLENITFHITFKNIIKVLISMIHQRHGLKNKSNKGRMERLFK